MPGGRPARLTSPTMPMGSLCESDLMLLADRPLAGPALARLPLQGRASCPRRRTPTPLS